MIIDDKGDHLHGGPYGGDAVIDVIGETKKVIVTEDGVLMVIAKDNKRSIYIQDKKSIGGRCWDYSE